VSSRHLLARAALSAGDLRAAVAHSQQAYRGFKALV